MQLLLQAFDVQCTGKIIGGMCQAVKCRDSARGSQSVARRSSLALDRKSNVLPVIS
jgi:hypothetical protein